MPLSLPFCLATACILIHEMDAIRCHEWRMFPGLSWLNDPWGFGVFMFAHIPLYGWLLWGVTQADPSGFVRGLDVFYLVHLGLHLLFLWHPKNEFKDGLSWLWIAGAALGGGLDLMAG